MIFWVLFILALGVLSTLPGQRLTVNAVLPACVVLCFVQAPGINASPKTGR